MSNYEDGLKKKSFELSYNNGSIWCEHLDGLFDKRDLVIKKFTEDLNIIKCPSTSSFIAINLDETDVDKKLLDFIIGTLNTLEKRICKVVIVGLGPMMKVHIRKINTGFCLFALMILKKQRHGLFEAWEGKLEKRYFIWL